MLIALTSSGGQPAAAQETVSDCTAFSTFAEANDFYAQHPEAMDLLDDDGDGTACEVYFEREDRSGDARGADQSNRQDPLIDESGGQAAAAGLDCEDFATQEEAQAVLDEDPNDPNNLDPNRDGIACALLPSAVSSLLAQTEEPADAEPNREERRNRRRQAQDQTAAEVTVVTCDNYATQEEAQAAFDQDPAGLAALDSDQDGQACEELLESAPADDRAARRAQRQAERNQAETAQPETAQPETAQPETPQTETPQPEVETPEVVVAETVAAPGPEDIDCVDFEFQEDAQAVYDSNPADPYNLDPNGDGFACSSLPMRNPVIVSVPRTGSGHATAAPSRALVLIALLLVGGGVSVLMARPPRINTSRR